MWQQLTAVLLISTLACRSQSTTRAQTERQSVNAGASALKPSEQPQLHLADTLDVPVISSDPSWICDSKEFYNDKGELRRGSTACVGEDGSGGKTVSACASAGEQNCITSGGYVAVKACSKEGESDCYVVSPIYRAASADGLANKLLTGQSVAGIAGAVTLPDSTKVLAGARYGVGNSSGAGALTLPAASNVMSVGAAYGDSSLPVTPALAAVARPAAPTITSASFNFAPERISLSWSPAAGASGYIVLLQTAAITWTPTDGTTYAPGPYGSATMIYAGAATSVSYNTAVSGANNYYLAVYAYQASKVYSPLPSTQIIYSCANLSGGSWVTVPGDSIYATNAFCVQKYAPSNVSNIPTSQAGTAPWVSISRTNALINCGTLGSGYHLITNPEWMTLAANLANVGSNWSGGTVGSGVLRSGHSDNNPASACAADASDANAYVETTCTGTSSGTFSQRRTATLANGAVVWDLGGNIWNWVNYFNDSNKPTPATAAYYEYTAITASIVTPMSHLIPISSAQPWWTDTWNSAQGIGKIYPGSNNSEYGVLMRGGPLNGGTNAGPFAAHLHKRHYDTISDTGFRCVYQP